MKVTLKAYTTPLEEAHDKLLGYAGNTLVAECSGPAIKSTPPKIQIGAFSPITEYERRVIAAQILAGFCADPKASCVDDHEVELAVGLADKLIARVRATHK